MLATPAMFVRPGFAVAAASLALVALTVEPAAAQTQVAASEFVYVKQDRTNFEMRKRNANGANDMRLFAGCLARIRGYCAYLDPAIAPQGNRLVFTHDAVGEVSCKTLWVADLNGSNAQQITMGCNHVEPSWSPDGRYVAFESGNQIMEVEMCGNSFPERSPRVITTGSHPSYSPDGRWLAFERDNNIYKVRRTGSGEAALAITGSQEQQPRWTKPGWNDEAIHYLGVTRSDGGSMVLSVKPDATGRSIKVRDVDVRHTFDVALLPSAWIWENDGEMFFRSGTSTRSLGPGRDPVMGHGTIQVKGACR